MRSRWRAFIETVLPWYDPAHERARNRRTEAIRVRSIAIRITAERVIEAYAQADWRKL
jgi:hypothetical protein